ncbi:MAG: PAS domain-containing sensor histidine kinase [Burkholderiales bacterium]|nr:PAS domain-containing sensor histidine kinase [Burkholderiales bacterium]
MGGSTDTDANGRPMDDGSDATCCATPPPPGAAAAAARQAAAWRALRAGSFRLDFARREFDLDVALLELYRLPTSRPELPFERWLDAVHPEDRARAVACTEPGADAGAIAGPERWRFRRCDGSTIWVEHRGECETDAAGRIVALVGSHRDVTAEADAQEWLRSQSRAEARRAAQARGEMLAPLVHGLRTELHSILGLASAIRRHGGGRGGAPEVADAARLIEMAGEEVGDAAVELEDLARASDEDFAWRAQAVSLRAAIDECATLLRRCDARAGDRLRHEIDEHCEPVLADPAKLRRILLTLFDRLFALVEGDIGIAAKVGGSGVQLDFCDLSPPRGDAGASFARAGPAVAAPLPHEAGGDPEPGGLTACRRLARMMGGHLAVNRQAAGRWIFSLSLPRARGTAVRRQR